MAKQDVIKIFRTSTPGREPLISELEDGELFLNIEDGFLFFKKNNGRVVKLGETRTSTFTIATAGQTTFDIPADAKTVISFFLNQIDYSSYVQINPAGSGQVVYDDQSSEYTTELNDAVKIIYL